MRALASILLLLPLPLAWAGSPRSPEPVDIVEWEVPIRMGAEGALYDELPTARNERTRPRDPYVHPDGRIFFCVQRGSADVQYGQHTDRGTVVEGDGARWRLRWTAPAHGAGSIVVHVAANASNDDDSELGDYVYVGEWRSEPLAIGR